MKLRNCLNLLSKRSFTVITELESFLAENPVNSGDDFSFILKNLCNGCGLISRKDIKEINLFCNLLDNLLADDCLREFEEQSNIIIKMHYHLSLLVDTMLSTFLERENVAKKVLRQMFKFFCTIKNNMHQPSYIEENPLKLSLQEINEYIRKYKFRVLAALFGVNSDIYNKFFNSLLNFKVVATNNTLAIDSRLLSHEFDSYIIHDDNEKKIGEISYKDNEFDIYIYSSYEEHLQITGHLNVNAIFINGGKSITLNTDITSSFCVLSGSNIIINGAIAAGRLSISSHSATFNSEVKSKDMAIFGKDNITINAEPHAGEIRVLSDGKIEMNTQFKCEGYAIFSAKEVVIMESSLNEDVIIYGKKTIVPSITPKVSR